MGRALGGIYMNLQEVSPNTVGYSRDSCGRKNRGVSIQWKTTEKTWLRGTGPPQFWHSQQQTLEFIRDFKTVVSVTCF